MTPSFLRRLFARPTGPAQTRVALRTGSVVTEVGAAAILHALFSSISAHLEPDGWGSRFPTVMGSLYRGHLEAKDSADALRELRIIEAEFGRLPVSAVVWDFDDRHAQPSRHYRAPPEAGALADWFVTVNGLNLLRQGLIESVESAVEFGDDVRLISLGGPEDFFRDRG